jgi:predicted nucleic acid-binding protein
MPNGLKRIYWDACVFISYIEQTADRIAVIDAIFHQAHSTRDVEIFTSALSTAEVAFAETERINKALDPGIEKALDDLWADPLIRLVEVNPVVGRIARDVVRTTMIEHETLGTASLRSADAVHLATAQWINADEFHTYDQRLLRHSGLLGFPILEPIVPQPRLIP